MKHVHVSARRQWRRWLAKNHDQEKDGIWLILSKRKKRRPSLRYEEAVEEALCFGWIDSVINRIDEHNYRRKFTPRNKNSRWSDSNKKRAQKLIKEGRMTEFGLAKIRAAKASGRWAMDPRPVIPRRVPRDLSEALGRNRTAKDFFEALSPTCRRQFVAWIVTARKPETRAKRLSESVALLGRGEKLGLS